FLDVDAIGVAHVSAFIDVSPVDREARNGLANDLAQNRESEIACATILIRDLVQTMRQHIHLACQRPSHHQFLAVVNDSLGADRSSDYTLVKPGKCPLIAAI